MKKYVVAGVVVAAALVVGTAITRFTLSALPEPGQTETFLATKAKHLLIHKGSRQGVPPPPADAQAAIKEGDKLFGMECASCHGASGYDLTDGGRWMYPRAADLTSRDSQSYSDREIFWIIKNGVRMSGMPAFGKVESDEHIWELALYVRHLPKTVPKPQVAQR
jgi:mono/diheme cytochrome c family protein